MHNYIVCQIELNVRFLFHAISSFYYAIVIGQPEEMMGSNGWLCFMHDEDDRKQTQLTHVCRV